MSLGQLQLLKQIIAAGDASASLPVEELRANFDRFLGRFPGVEGLAVEAGELDGVAIEWLDPPLVAPLVDGEHGQPPTVVYLHGGGFVVGSPRSHRQTAARLAQAAGARALLVDYRLAPEHPYPAALADVLSVWRRLLGDGADPRRLLLAGDSAGGGLAVLAMSRMARQGLAPPAAAVVISPWVDYAGTTASLDANAHLDPTVQRPGLEKMAALYLDGADPWHPEVTPLRADLRALPPLLIQAGGAETLVDDARRLESRARAAGVSVQLEIWPQMIHAWHVFAARLEEAQQALEEAGHFLAGHVLPATSR